MSLSGSHTKNSTRALAHDRVYVMSEFSQAVSHSQRDSGPKIGSHATAYAANETTKSKLGATVQHRQESQETLHHKFSTGSSSEDDFTFLHS